MSIMTQAVDYIKAQSGTYDMDGRGRIPLGDVIRLMRDFHRHMLHGAGPVGERVSGQRGTSEASGSGVSPNGTPDARDRDEGAGTPK